MVIGSICPISVEGLRWGIGPKGGEALPSHIDVHSARLSDRQTDRQNELPDEMRGLRPLRGRCPKRIEGKKGFPGRAPKESRRALVSPGRAPERVW
jgi:hypothetical protein